jgi:hypothetical protein
MLWCPLQFPQLFLGDSCLAYVICVYLRVVVCDMSFVVFLFVLLRLRSMLPVSLDFQFKTAHFGYSLRYIWCVCSLSMQTPLIDCSLRCSNKRICVYMEYILMYSFPNNILLFFMSCRKLSCTFIEHRIIHTRIKRAVLSCSITGNIIDRSVGFGNRFYPSHFCVSPNKSSYLI